MNSAMRCDDVKERLSSYVDQDLSRERRTELDAHLASCEACRADLASLQGMLAALG